MIRGSWALMCGLGTILVGCSNDLKSPPEAIAVKSQALTGVVAAYGFDEASGNDIADATGHGHDTTLSGQFRVAGKYGGALDFAGDSLAIADSNSLDLSDGMTVSVWIRPAEEHEDAPAIVAKEWEFGSVYGLGAGFSYLGTPLGPGGWIVSDNTYASVGTWIDEEFGTPVDAWTHLAVSYDSERLVLYVNGDPVAEEPFDQPIDATDLPLMIGGIQDQPFIGVIDEVRVYDRGLSEDEIETDAHTPINQTAPDTTCLLYTSDAADE